METNYFSWEERFYINFTEDLKMVDDLRRELSRRRALTARENSDIEDAPRLLGDSQMKIRRFLTFTTLFQSYNRRERIAQQLAVRFSCTAFLTFRAAQEDNNLLFDTLTASVDRPDETELVALDESLEDVLLRARFQNPRRERERLTALGFGQSLYIKLDYGVYPEDLCELLLMLKQPVLVQLAEGDGVHYSFDGFGILRAERVESAKLTGFSYFLEEIGGGS